MNKFREGYGYTTGSHRTPLFNSSRLHGLNVSARKYRTEHDYYIDVFFRNRWYHGNHNRDEVSLSQAWNSFIVSVENNGRDAWLTKLILVHNTLSRSRQPVFGMNCTDFFERQVYLASRGERIVRVVLTTQFASQVRPTSLTSPIEGRASRPRCTK